MQLGIEKMSGRTTIKGHSRLKQEFDYKQKMPCTNKTELKFYQKESEEIYLLKV